MEILIAKEWENFAKTLYTNGVSEIQFIETRRAFYAGMASMMKINLELPEVIELENPNANEDEEYAAYHSVMKSIENQFLSYGKSVGTDAERNEYTRFLNGEYTESELKH